ncbi:MAG: 3-phosphoshikimate 1-carboxyvinyltransferase [Planctomycetota bacterium]
MSPAHSRATVEVTPGGAVRGRVRPPGSKSLTNRALICAAFARGRSELRGALDSEDTRVMIAALREVGFDIKTSGSHRHLKVGGAMGRHAPAGEQALFIANSGTSVRFLAAALAAFGGRYRLHGVERMHARPIADLVDAIAPHLQGTIRALSPHGCPPVEIDSRGYREPGASMAIELSVAGNVSSQYLSGLMMSGPIQATQANESAPRSLRVAVDGDLVSLPYVEMTAAVMRDFGVSVSIDATQPSGHLVSICGAYRGCQYAIEPDASAASYFWAAAAITGGQVTVAGLNRRSLQGDVRFVDVLEKMGCKVEWSDEGITVSGRAERGIDVDMNSISDTVQTLSVVALFASQPTRVRGVAHNRFKETDRIGDLARELRRLGATVDEHEDGLTIHPLPEARLDSEREPTKIQTYHDHRMAMSLALAGLRMRGVLITDPSCTGKTYPNYWYDLETLIGRSHHWSSSEDRQNFVGAASAGGTS